MEEKTKKSPLLRFCEIVALIGAVCIVTMIIVTVVDVIGRKVIGQSFAGATEIVTYFLTAVVYFGVGYCAIERGMIIIDLFPRKHWIYVFNNILSIIASILIIRATLIQAYNSYLVGGSSLRISIPKWPFMVITAFGFAMMAIILALQTVEDTKKYLKEKKEKKAGVSAAAEDIQKGGEYNE